MTDARSTEQSDEWSKWLLHLRHGGDAAFRQRIQVHLDGYADRILDGAKLKPGMMLVDVGCGEGLIAFSAIERIGASLQTILTDISAPMIAHTQALARERGVLEQCKFIQCAADELSAIEDYSADVVTTRAVLAYVSDKNRALREFFRVLKPGGRISFVEPVLWDDALATCNLRALACKQTTAAVDTFQVLLHRWKAAQFPDTQEKLLANPLTNFNERTLFDMVRAAGFAPIHAELHMDMDPSDILTWTVFLESCPHPWAPTLSDILANQFSSDERGIFERVMRPLVESGKALSISRTVYFNAEKPAV